jgi:hypothetical protein
VPQSLIEPSAAAFGKPAAAIVLPSPECGYTSGKTTLTRVDAMNHQSGRRSVWSWWYLLFLIQFIAVLWPPFYNRLEPTLAGIPFFYWYQFAWVIIGAVLTAIVYFVTED